MSRVDLFNFALALTALFALWRGGTPERIVAGLFMGFAGAHALIARHIPDPFLSVHWLIVFLDVLLLLALVALSAIADRYWVMWAAALQLVSVGTALMLIADSSLTKWIYVVLHGVWSYPLIGLLACGTWRHRQRLTRNGADASWSISSIRWLRTRRRLPVA